MAKEPTLLTTTDIMVLDGTSLMYRIDPLNDTVSLLVEDETTMSLSLERASLPRWIAALARANARLEAIGAIADEAEWERVTNAEVRWEPFPETTH